MSEFPQSLQQVDRTGVRISGRTLVYFGGCDYFRLASHPAVRRAARRALDSHGLNVAASRLTTGNHRLYGELERRLAAYFGVEHALVMSSASIANFALAQTLAGDFTHALLDSRAHACLREAARFLGCPALTFDHRRPDAVARLVRRLGRRARLVLLTDGLFAHDGSVAPLRAYREVLPPGAFVLVDDAHGAGVLGPRGRGTPDHEQVGRDRLFQTLTLSKAFGAFGGVVLCDRSLRDRILQRSDLFAGTTPPPLPVAAAALQALQILRTDAGPRTRLRRNIDYVKDTLRTAGVSIPPTPGPIVSILPRRPAEAARLRRRLLVAGIHPPFIRYPGGPAEGYFRFALSSEHTRPQLDRLIEVLIESP
jgi:7-keto-8-aminopelargonate synthetase-like enzyme